MKDFRVLCSGEVAVMLANLGLKNGYIKDDGYDHNLSNCIYLQFTNTAINPVSVEWAYQAYKNQNNWITVDAVIEMFNKDIPIREIKVGQKFKRKDASSTFRMLQTPGIYWCEKRFYQDIEDINSLYFETNLETVVTID